MANPYEVLGVTPTASNDEIRKAYRKLAKLLHPDLNPGDAASEEKFKKVTGAYDLIGDAEKRRRFDAGEIDEAAPSRGAAEAEAPVAGGHERGERGEGLVPLGLLLGGARVGLVARGPDRVRAFSHGLADGAEHTGSLHVGRGRALGVHVEVVPRGHARVADDAQRVAGADEIAEVQRAGAALLGDGRDVGHRPATWCVAHNSRGDRLRRLL